MAEQKIEFTITRSNIIGVDSVPNVNVKLTGGILPMEMAEILLNFLAQMIGGMNAQAKEIHQKGVFNPQIQK